MDFFKVTSPDEVNQESESSLSPPAELFPAGRTVSTSEGLQTLLVLRGTFAYTAHTVTGLTGFHLLFLTRQRAKFCLGGTTILSSRNEQSKHSRNDC